MQTGYLTIKGAETQGRSTVLTLGYPNLEVQDAMSEHLARGLGCVRDNDFSSICNRIYGGLRAGEVDEVKTARGRIDAVVETPQFVYVFEFKICGTSEEAMAQIEEKDYAAKFASDPRKLFKIGCAFDWEKRNLGQWLIA